MQAPHGSIPGTAATCRRLTLAAAIFAILLAGLAPAAATPTGRDRLFGTEAVESSDLSAFTKWAKALERFHREGALAGGPCNDSSLDGCDQERWRNFLADARGLSPREQIEAVNREMNAHSYVVDPRNWGQTDYWASPGQFTRRDGDCEDFAIAKFLSLRALGFANDDLRIVVLQDLNLRLAHAILVVYHDGEYLVLDNQISTVVPADVVRHYRPIYSINETRWWLHQP